MRRILLVTGLLCLFGSSAFAGGFALFGAYAETSDVDEANGAGARLSLGQGLSFDVSFTYLRETDGPAIDGLGEDYELQMLPIDLGVRYLFDLDGFFDPYIGAGLTYFILDANNVRTDDEVGYYGQLGFELMLYRATHLMVEVMYRQVDATIEWHGYSGLPEVVDRVDDTLGGLAANVGLIWRF